MAKVLVTNLVGRFVEKGRSFNPGDRAWPYNSPAVDGQHIASIEAVWIDRDDSIKALFRLPTGETFEGWPSHYRLIDTPVL